MPSSRAITALGGLAVGLLVSVGVWVYLEASLPFLFVPLTFLPFLLLLSDRADGGEGHSVRTYPDVASGRGYYEYSPRDGTRLGR